MIRLFLVCLLVFTTIIFSVAQDIRDELMAAFDSDAVWITSYNGVIGNTNRINLYFADDGSKFIVKSQYPSTGTITDYDRQAKGDTIILTEYQELRKVGELYLWKDGGGYQGYWKHANGDTKPVVFYKSLEDINCGQMKYHHILLGEKHQYEVKRDYKYPNLKVDGNVIDVSCLKSTCAEFSFYFDKMEYIMSYDASRDWKLKSEKNIQELEHTYGYEYVCEEYTAYEQLWSLEYPDLNDDLFKVFLLEKIDAIMIDFKKGDNSYAVSDRFNVLIKNWVDVTFFNDEMISGYIYAQASLTDKVNKSAFIYDLKNHEAIELDQSIFSMFNKANKMFAHAVLSPKGLELTSDFHPIYGEQKQLLTFAEAKNKIENKRLRKFCKKYE